MQIETDPPGRLDWEHWTATAPLEQSWGYGAAAAYFGARVVRARLVSGGRVAGAAQVVGRRFAGIGLGCAARGIHWREAPLAGAEAALAGALGRGALVIAGEAGIALSGRRAMARLALDRPIRPAMVQKWRNRLNRAERQGLFVLRERGCPDWLLRAEAAARRQRRYGALPARWLGALGRACPGSVETWGAYREGAPVAGITTIRHGAVLTYHLGWSGEAGRRASAHHLLLTRAIEAAAEQGAAAADLGLLDPDRLPGLTRFKLGTGAAAEEIPAMRLHLAGPARGLPAGRAADAT